MKLYAKDFLFMAIKGIPIDGLYKAVKVSSQLFGNMAWETPYAILEALSDGSQVMWVSNDAALLIEGREYGVEAFAYENPRGGLLRLRRVHITNP